MKLSKQIDFAWKETLGTDGRGPDRLVNALEIMLSPAQKEETLRIAA